MERIINGIKVKCDMPLPDEDRDKKIIKVFNEMMADELFSQLKKSNQDISEIIIGKECK